MSRRRTAAAVAAAGLLALAGCSSSGSGSDPSAEASAADVGWSPCDGLTAKHVGRYAGEPMTEEDGTADRPRCTFAPVTRGGPAFDVSYLWFDGGLDDALSSAGRAAGGLRPIDVPGADAARLAVDPRTGGILVTGFVQSGGLVQSVNAVDLRPYDERVLVTATERLLADLVTNAPRR